MTVLPVERIGSMRGDVLAHPVERTSDGVVGRIGPDAWPIRRPYVVGTTPQQQLERLREQIQHGSADGLVVVGHLPATEAEFAARIFFRPTGGLNDAIQTDEFGNEELAHSLLQVRPRESSPQGMPTITATNCFIP